MKINFLLGRLKNFLEKDCRIFECEVNDVQLYYSQNITLTTYFQQFLSSNNKSRN